MLSRLELKCMKRFRCFMLLDALTGTGDTRDTIVLVVRAIINDTKVFLLWLSRLGQCIFFLFAVNVKEPSRSLTASAGRKQHPQHCLCAKRLRAEFAENALSCNWIFFMRAHHSEVRRSIRRLGVVRSAIALFSTALLLTSHTAW